MNKMLITFKSQAISKLKVKRSNKDIKLISITEFKYNTFTKAAR